VNASIMRDYDPALIKRQLDAAMAQAAETGKQDTFEGLVARLTVDMYPGFSAAMIREQARGTGAQDFIKALGQLTAALIASSAKSATPDRDARAMLVNFALIHQATCIAMQLKQPDAEAWCQAQPLQAGRA
jgi:hypothetical protein